MGLCCYLGCQFKLQFRYFFPVKIFLNRIELKSGKRPGTMKLTLEMICPFLKTMSHQKKVVQAQRALL